MALLEVKNIKKDLQNAKHFQETSKKRWNFDNKPL